MVFGPDIVLGDVTKHPLFIANDNDFTATVTDSNHPTDIGNLNKLFVFAIDATDLPDFVPHQISMFQEYDCADDR